MEFEWRKQSLSEREERRLLFEKSEEELAFLASNALKKGFAPDEIVAYCIEIGDCMWADLAEVLTPPDTDWQEIVNSGENQPVLWGTMEKRCLTDILCEVIPDIESIFKTPTEGNQVQAVVMGAKGISVFSVTPSPGYKYN